MSRRGTHGPAARRAGCRRGGAATRWGGSCAPPRRTCRGWRAPRAEARPGSAHRDRARGRASGADGRPPSHGGGSTAWTWGDATGSPARRLALFEQPGTEERAQVAAALALGERDEVGGRDVAVAVVAVPVAQEAEERAVADFDAQRL